MKKVMLTLFVLVTLMSSVEAIEIMNGEEFTDVIFYLDIGFLDYDYTIVFSTEKKSLGLYVNVDDSSDDLTFASKDYKVFICLVYIYIMLTPIEFMGLALLIIIALTIILVILSKRKQSKQNKEERDL